ncbi:prolyl oligopeptidase family serine peptidase [Butyrivibrio sp. WCE2006]|uniref:carboxylesterase family protein n=1 Tax=Butyrivibrio sp. WCE2006 TaxID=1410611 RepID=UPI0005D2B47D|nr:prolyl oligopeptidase family serine peptidase [Butyrivibrio sp. WCE2006]
MSLPTDWDKPSPENSILCERFQYGVFDYSGTLPYRFFVPETLEKVPLVVFLHGADAYGDDNELQLSMHDIGTVFAADSWQKKHPCYVLAPQCRKGRHWSGLLEGNRICVLVKRFMEQYANIDPERIYIYGYSAGGVGCLEILKYHSEMFAGAVSICGATGFRDLSNLLKTPIWLIHAADDNIVKASYRENSVVSTHLGSRDIYAELKDKHPDLHYTEYEAGDLKEKYGINPHCSWVLAGRDGQVKEWLFSNERC